MEQRVIAFEDDVSAIQWCQFCVSLSGSLLNILQLFASFSQNPKLLQWRTVLKVSLITLINRAYSVNNML